MSFRLSICDRNGKWDDHGRIFPVAAHAEELKKVVLNRWTKIVEIVSVQETDETPTHVWYDHGVRPLSQPLCRAAEGEAMSRALFLIRKGAAETRVYWHNQPRMATSMDFWETAWHVRHPKYVGLELPVGAVHYRTLVPGPNGIDVIIPPRPGRPAEVIATFAMKD